MRTMPSHVHFSFRGGAGYTARMDVLTCAGLGRAHAFTLRSGGVSTGAFASANLGRGLGDAPDAVEENHARLAGAVGYPVGRLFEVSQVHGARIREVGATEDPRVVRAEEADAIIAREHGVAIGVRVADCVPLLMSVRGQPEVAAVHAGWRGVASRIAVRAIEALRDGRAVEVDVALGPHIRQAHFEVGEEVVDALLGSTPGCEGAIDRTRPKPHVDLAAVLRAQLAPHAAEVLDAGGDTYSEPARFFSYRRDGGTTGRHVAVVVA